MKRPVQRQPWHRRVHKKTSGLFMCPPATRFPPGSKTYFLLNVRLYRLLLAGNRSLRSRPAGSARSCAGEVTTAERKAPLLRREGLSSPQACVQQQRVHTALQSGRARKKTGGLERSSTCATVFPKRDFRSPFLSHRFLTVEGCLPYGKIARAHVPVGGGSSTLVLVYHPGDWVLLLLLLTGKRHRYLTQKRGLQGETDAWQ